MGTLPGLAFALLLVLASTSQMIGHTASGGSGSAVVIAQPGGYPPLVTELVPGLGWTVAWYLTGGLIAYAGCLTAVSGALRAVADPGRRRTVGVLAVVFPLIGLLSVAAAVLTAARTGFAYGVTVQLRTAGAGAVVLLLGLTCVRLATVLRERRHSTSVGTV